MQRAVAKKQRGSKRRQKAVQHLARLHQRIALQRKDYAHKVSRQLVNHYQLIAVEDLNVQGMAKNHNLAKSIVDAGWSQLVQFVMYKAESAGRQVVQVNPYNTSQQCSNCGEIVKKSLSERLHRCSCGYVNDRDVNATRNILQMALQKVS
ncbi:RNA-guided endonuclease InsQ/TnpB family protein [Brevibacillus sp. SYSU BS000544]|uniref:RNA-guided endonuclease InsQ/TnpB family protein n=1 Tax=Brevibacillus sp. SYSU BS000544 TaxID=3416443 RepID=UPI003CE552FC